VAFRAARRVSAPLPDWLGRGADGGMCGVSGVFHLNLAVE